MNVLSQSCCHCFLLNLIMLSFFLLTLIHHVFFPIWLRHLPPQEAKIYRQTNKKASIKCINLSARNMDLYTYIYTLPPPSLGRQVSPLVAYLRVSPPSLNLLYMYPISPSSLMIVSTCVSEHRNRDNSFPCLFFPLFSNCNIRVSSLLLPRPARFTKRKYLQQLSDPSLICPLHMLCFLFFSIDLSLSCLRFPSIPILFTSVFALLCVCLFAGYDLYL